MPRAHAARVLIVEDDADAADLFARWLRRAGYSVSTVSDAPRALILASVLRPAVLVIDLGLPGIGGMALIAQLRELPELVTSRYIAVTGHTGVELPALCSAAGFDAFFQKPVPRAALLKSVGHEPSWEALAHYH